MDWPLQAETCCSMGQRTANQEGCSENHLVNRYEASQAARIAQLETEVKLRDANTYTDQKLLQVHMSNIIFISKKNFPNGLTCFRFECIIQQ